MRVITDKPEVLAPAGTLEKLKVAINYGADAVASVEMYGLRSRAGNFHLADARRGSLCSGTQCQSLRGVISLPMKVIPLEQVNFGHCAILASAQMIVSDPSLIEIAITEAPETPVHLSAQASATNYETLNFWQAEGLERVVLA